MSSPRLELPFVAAAQAQKHVTVNQALTRLDQLVHLSIAQNDLTAPPPSPAEGAIYGVGAAPTGAFAGQAGRLAVHEGGFWEFIQPKVGWRAWNQDRGRFEVFAGAAWRPVLGDQVERLGIGAAPATGNALTVEGAATLFSHGPGGSHRIAVNRAAGGTASLLFQTGHSGRAELGLAGSDTLAIKTSADGLSWSTPLTASAGAVAPGADNGAALGSAARRWSEIWAASGVIQTSDARDKRAIAPIDGRAALAVVAAAAPVTFRWEREAAGPGAARHAGFLAQEVRAALVAEGFDCAAWGLADAGDPDSRQWLRPDQLGAVLWAAVRALAADVARLGEDGAGASRRGLLPTGPGQSREADDMPPASNSPVNVVPLASG